MTPLSTCLNGSVILAPCSACSVYYQHPAEMRDLHKRATLQHAGSIYQSAPESQMLDVCVECRQTLILLDHMQIQGNVSHSKFLKEM